MRKSSYRFGIVLQFLVIGFILLSSVNLMAQSLVAGDIAGMVTDSSNAVVPNAVVKLKSLDTGANLSTKTNSAGAYRFTLLKPGSYRVSITEEGFAPATESATVAVGSITTANITLKVSGASTTVEVTAATPLITTDPGSTTSFTKQDLELLPSAGSDLTNIAQTAPGVVSNTVGGNQYGGGNFSINGLPAVSNMFTVNGENDMDPYFNVNNSGATNLTIGQNEMSEAAVITNAYGGQYGQLSGAQVTYVTKSGTNNFHGNALYWWNGRTLNANDWMNNNSGTPRPFANNNQYAASVGGPIIKDRTFFFVDYEGVRMAIPTSNGPVVVPSPAFSNAVYQNVLAVQPNEAPLYRKMLDLWANAATGKTLTPSPSTACTSALGLTGFTPLATTDCANSFGSNPMALAHEWVLAARVDHRFSDKDTLYGRYKMDHGLQPSYIDQISPNFDALSNQPSWDLQLNETHIINNHSANQFMASGSHYVAQFSQNQSLANDTFPARIITSGNVPFTGFNPESSFPQGRNITQYQFVDDYTLSIGAHSLKFGGNFRRYDVSDHNFFYNDPAIYFGYVDAGLSNFSNGLAYQYRRSLNIAAEVPIKMYGLGLYAQDEWAVNRKLKLTLALRVERNGNPACGTNCFANFVSSFATLPSTAAGANSGDVPYNQDIKTGVSNAFSGVDALNLSPRIGFAWSPKGDSSLVVSGGFGVFFDGPPGGLLDNLTANPPISVALRVRPKNGTPAFDPTNTGSAYTWQQSANAFSTGFGTGGTYTQIASALSAYNVAFAAPAFTSLLGTFHSPRYFEWNFQVQKEIHRGTAIVVNYVGNSGSNIPYSSAWGNAFDEYGTYSSPIIAQAPPNPNYGTITEWKSGAISNYNGLNITLRHQFTRALTVHANYTWGHGLDDVSNGGAVGNNAFNSTSGYSLASDAEQVNPSNFRKYNYGNADYDVRHSFNLDYVFAPTISTGNRMLGAVINGWQWSGKMFFRSGMPYSVIDGNWALGNGGGAIYAQPLAGQAQSAGCGGGNANQAGNASPCLMLSGFFNTNATLENPDGLPYSAFSTQERNQYRGPHYIDFDMGLAKNIKLYENVNLGVGMQAFNVFNHPNFGLPQNDISSGSFGVISSMASLPTTPYGSGLGFASEARVLQLSAKITF